MVIVWIILCALLIIGVGLATGERRRKRVLLAHDLNLQVGRQIHSDRLAEHVVEQQRGSRWGGGSLD